MDQRGVRLVSSRPHFVGGEGDGERKTTPDAGPNREARSSDGGAQNGVAICLPLELTVHSARQR